MTGSAKLEPRGFSLPTSGSSSAGLEILNKAPEKHRPVISPPGGDQLETRRFDCRLLVYHPFHVNRFEGLGDQRNPDAATNQEQSRRKQARVADALRHYPSHLIYFVHVLVKSLRAVVFRHNGGPRNQILDVDTGFGGISLKLRGTRCTWARLGKT
jgi:hypothetical protein